MEFKKNNKGVTIAEIIIVAGIFVVGLVGMLSNALALFKATSFSGDSLIATNLAREALEVVHNKRDNNFLVNDPNFRNGFDFAYGVIKPDFSSGSFNGNFTIDQISVDFDKCIQNQLGCEIYLDESSGIFGDTGMAQIVGATKTKFYRMVIFTPISCIPGSDLEINNLCSAGEIYALDVDAEVRWNIGTRVEKVNAEIALYDWQ